VYREIDPSYLLPRSFYTRSGVKLKNSNNGICHSWKVGVEIFNHPDLKYFRDSFYQNKTGSVQDPNTKILPSNDVLISFFSDKNLVNLILAHLFMQDGGIDSQFLNGHLYKTIGLYVFSKQSEMCSRLCYVIFHTTGLRLKVL